MLNVVERLKVASERGGKKPPPPPTATTTKTRKEIRPAVIGDLQELRFHRQVEARTRLKVAEDTEATYIESLCILKQKDQSKEDGI